MNKSPRASSRYELEEFKLTPSNILLCPKKISYALPIGDEAYKPREEDEYSYEENSLKSFVEEFDSAEETSCSTIVHEYEHIFINHSEDTENLYVKCQSPGTSSYKRVSFHLPSSPQRSDGSHSGYESGSSLYSYESATNAEGLFCFNMLWCVDDHEEYQECCTSNGIPVEISMLDCESISSQSSGSNTFTKNEPDNGQYMHNPVVLSSEDCKDMSKFIGVLAEGSFVCAEQGLDEINDLALFHAGNESNMEIATSEKTELEEINEMVVKFSTSLKEELTLEQEIKNYSQFITSKSKNYFETTAEYEDPIGASAEELLVINKNIQICHNLMEGEPSLDEMGDVLARARKALIPREFLCEIYLDSLRRSKTRFDELE